MTKEKLPIKLSASMMCANYLILQEEVERLDEAGIDFYHIDIMDGSFVDNYAMSNLELKAISSISKTKFDIHLMICNPQKYIPEFSKFRPEYISVHYETDRQLHATLLEIKGNGIKTGVSINPGTSYKLLEPLLPVIDMVLVMTVNPGFAGQKFIYSSIDKVRGLRTWLDDLGYDAIEIEVDGSIGEETVKLLRDAGANIFVLGTSGLFKENMDYCKNLEVMRSEID